MPNQFTSPEGELENYFVTEYWLIDQYIGDQLWSWGYDRTGRLGNAAITDRSTPVTTFAGGTNWKQVANGYNFCAAIKTDGTLWTWGAGAQGHLGTNDVTNRSTPVTTFSGGTNWKQVGCGAFHIAAIKTDGTLWTWGGNSNGQLGINDVTNRSTPVTTFAGGTNWKQVGCGAFHIAAIKTDGTLWTWGGGTAGQLGTNDVTNRSTPVTTFAGGTNWKQVGCGGQHTAAIKTDGTLWTWGYGLATGANTGTSRSTPVTTFAGGSSWKQVSSGASHTAAIKTDGTLWTWGLNAGPFGPGALGTNDTTNRSTPVTTFAGGTNWKQVGCGGQHTAAIKTDGTLWTWGYGLATGANTGTSRSTPVTTFAGGTNWKQVSASGSSYYTSAVQSGINPEYPLS
jgi:alpha-tubulin suppressor-like RCC1 family protein